MDFTGYRQIVATFCVVLDIRFLPCTLTVLTIRRLVYSCHRRVKIDPREVWPIHSGCLGFKATNAGK